MTVQEIRASRHTERMVNAVKYNEEVRSAWINIWVRNAARNYAYIEHKFKDESRDIMALPRAKGEPCLILASGPSLDDVASHLKDWEGTIFCSTSQLSLLEYLGVDPTYVVYIDADPTQDFLITDKYRNGTSSILLTHPQMPLEILKIWGGETYFFRMFDPGDDFSTKYLPPMYGGLNLEKQLHLGSYVLNSGCVANAMIALAQSLGYAPIFLCGYDLGYPGGVRRFTNWVQKDGKWESHKEMLPPERPVFEGNNGITTDELSCFYKYSLMIMWGLGNPPIISCSRGILSELPWADPQEVISQQGEGFTDRLRPPIESYRMSQQYLRDRGIFIARTRTRVETTNVTGKNWLQVLAMRLAYWRADEYSREFERGRPSLYRKVKEWIRRIYGFADIVLGRRLGSVTTERASGDTDGGGDPQVPAEGSADSPEAPVVHEHPTEQAPEA